MTPDILLTGIPRSGTTLSCALLNQAPNVVALVEPMDVRGFVHHRPPKDWRHDIDTFLAHTRQSLLKYGQARGRVIHGTTDDNTFGSARDASGLRQAAITPGTVAVEKTLTPDFTLIIKHPNAFTAMLPELAPHYRCYALIRNPVSVLASWNSVNVPLRHGHAPAAEAADPALAQHLSNINDVIERQLALLDWYYQQYQQYLPASHILRYEDIIATQGQSLFNIIGSHPDQLPTLNSRNQNSLYDTALMDTLRQRLITRGGTFEAFYPTSKLNSEH